MASAPASALPAAETKRPEARLPLLMLLQLSIYWMGVNAVWGAVGTQALPNLAVAYKGPELGPIYNGILSVLGAIVAMVVQPTVGSISDYAVTRWGRRKPFIAIGGTLDVLLLLGIAVAPSFEVVMVLVVLLQFSANFAQGPFQGYVPDLVPAQQVGLASGLMGLMIILGQAAGAAMIFLSISLHDSGGASINGPFGLGIVGVGIFELASALATVLWVREGRGAKPRNGMSWLDVARSTWAADILAERSYLWFLGSRLFILAGTALLLGTGILYMRWSLGMTLEEASFWILVTAIVVGGTTAAAVLPAGLLSDRIGRKRVIYLACLVGAVGMVIVALAPGIAVALAGTLLVGMGAGTFVAVDWALMTDIIPKASSGRYMGISNVATNLGGGILPGIIGAVALSGTQFVTGIPADPRAPRLAMGAAIVLFAFGALLLRPVDERRHEDTETALAADSKP